MQKIPHLFHIVPDLGLVIRVSQEIGGMEGDHHEAKGVFILAIEADSFLSRNRTRFVSVINIGSLALPLDVTW